MYIQFEGWQKLGVRTLLDLANCYKLLDDGEKYLRLGVVVVYQVNIVASGWCHSPENIQVVYNPWIFLPPIGKFVLHEFEAGL